MKNKKLIIILTITIAILVFALLPSVVVPHGTNSYEVGRAVGRYSGEFLKTGFLIFSLGYFVYRYGIRRKPL